MVRGLLENFEFWQDWPMVWNGSPVSIHKRNIVFFYCRADAQCCVQDPTKRSFCFSSFQNWGIGCCPLWQVAKPWTDYFARISSLYCGRSTDPHQSYWGANPSLLPGYRVLYLDGNSIESTEHRLKVLQRTRAGPIPGKGLVVFDPQLGLAVDVFLVKMAMLRNALYYLRS